MLFLRSFHRIIARKLMTIYDLILLKVDVTFSDVNRH